MPYLYNILLFISGAHFTFIYKLTHQWLPYMWGHNSRAPQHVAGRPWKKTIDPPWASWSLINPKIMEDFSALEKKNRWFRDGVGCYSQHLAQCCQSNITQSKFNYLLKLISYIKIMVRLYQKSKACCSLGSWFGNSSFVAKERLIAGIDSVVIMLGTSVIMFDLLRL